MFRKTPFLLVSIVDISDNLLIKPHIYYRMFDEPADFLEIYNIFLVLF